MRGKKSNWEQIEAHHIKSFALIIEKNNLIDFKEALKCRELWDVDNGVTLCKECHNLTKKGRRKKGGG